MVEYAREQLARLHNVAASAIPQPRAGAFADWGLDPFGGDWSPAGPLRPFPPLLAAADYCLGWRTQEPAVKREMAGSRHPCLL
ncbi:MAG: hypothetical protein ACTHLH_07770 [Solirubrobacterales bacterium]